MLALATLGFYACKQENLKPKGLHMSENPQNDRVLFRHLSAEEEKYVTENVMQDPLFIRHVDTIVSVLAQAGISFNNIIDSVRINNPNLNNNNLKNVAMQIVQNNPSIREVGKIIFLVKKISIKSDMSF